MFVVVFTAFVTLSQRGVNKINNTKSYNNIKSNDNSIGSDDKRYKRNIEKIFEKRVRQSAFSVWRFPHPSPSNHQPFYWYEFWKHYIFIVNIKSCALLFCDCLFVHAFRFLQLYKWIAFHLNKYWIDRYCVWKEGATGSIEWNRSNRKLMINSSNWFAR